MPIRILVIIDPQIEKQVAFERAIELAELVDVSLQVVLFVESGRGELPAGVAEKLSIDSSINYVRQCEAWLVSLVKPHLERGLELNVEVKPFNRLYEAVIHAGLEHDVSYIFKPMRHHSLLRRVLYTSTDWNLIRTCPLPLLLINDEKPLRGREILAAVKFGNGDSDHDELNRMIMSQAVGIAKLYGSTIKVINAVPLPSIPMGFSPTEASGHHLITVLAEDHRKQAAKLAADFGLSEDKVVVVEGQAEVVINKFAEQGDAGILMIGSVAQSGLAGLFIGNTAERVLEESITDVLVLKQADFSSPLR